MRARPTPFLLAISFTLAAGLAACGGRDAASMPPEGVVNVTDGHGTAKVWDVAFTVEATGEGGSSFSTSGTTTLDGREIRFDAALTFGEVVVHLGPAVTTGDLTTRTMWVGGRDHGPVAPGDEVMVGAGPGREVTVNGEPRQPR